MDIILHQSHHTMIAEFRADEIVLSSVQDVLDLMMAADNQGAQTLIFHENNIAPDFFELRSGLAGEILQKCSNYSIRAAIVGNFSKYRSVSLQAFILESNRRGEILFMPSIEAALERLAH